jgi:hypothetical protein
LRFTSELDTINHASTDSDIHQNTIDFDVKALDNIRSGAVPTMIKIDLEGYEENVIEGVHNTLFNHFLLAVLLELYGSGRRYGLNESVLHEMMLACGCKSYHYSPLQRKLVSLKRNHNNLGNTLYIRNIDAVKKRVSGSPYYCIHNAGIWL